jgi:group I intron endonuclease
MLKQGYCHIYLIDNSVDENEYVGQTVCYTAKGEPYGYLKRFKSHITSAKNSRSRCRKLKNAMRFHGTDAFDVHLLEIVPEDEADDRETYHILQRNTIKEGYNLREGGHRGRASDETRKLQSEAKKGALHFQFGKTRSTETRDKISQTLIDNVVRYGHDGRLLPKYIKYVNWKDRVGYSIIGHPTINKKDFTSKKLTLDQHFDQAVTFMISNQ